MSHWWDGVGVKTSLVDVFFMRVGYACIVEGLRREHGGPGYVPAGSPKGLRVTVPRLWKIFQYNVERGLLLYRMSSEVSQATHPKKPHLRGEIEEYADELGELGGYALEHGLRLSMHPGQHVNLNSPRERVARESVRDYEWHARLMDTMGLPASHKIVTHVGGVYDDKQAAIERFIERYNTLPNGVRSRLVVENDERRFSSQDVLGICGRVGAPAVIDVLHHEVNAGHRDLGELNRVVGRANRTWKKVDGAQKIHYSTQQRGGRPGQHAYWIDMEEFMSFYRATRGWDYDVMLESGSKDLGALRVIRALKEHSISTGRNR